jgi:hypothetical protein
MALLDDLTMPTDGMTMFASPAAGGGGPAPAAPAPQAAAPSTDLPELDPATGPNGEDLYYSRRAKKYLTSKAYADMMKITPQDNPAAPIAAEDAAGLKKMLLDLETKRILATRSNDFMARQGQGPSAVSTGQVYGDIPLVNHVIPNFAKVARAGIDAVTHDDQAARIGKMDAINAETWAKLREIGSGAIRGFEAQGPTGWQQGFTHTANMGTTNADIRDRLNKEYAEAVPRAAFVQNFVHTRQGGYGAAEAAYDAQQLAAAKAAQDPRAAANRALVNRSAATRNRPPPGTIDLNP